MSWFFSGEENKQNRFYRGINVEKINTCRRWNFLVSFICCQHQRLATLGNICAMGNHTHSKALVLTFYVDVVSSFLVKSEEKKFD